MRWGILLATVLTVIGSGCDDDGGPERSSDRSHCSAPVSATVDWHDCDKRGVNLANQLLSGANLSGADLTDANLRGAQIVKVDMAGTDLTGADLEGAFFSGGYPQGATFCRTTMPDGTEQSSGC